MIKDKLSFEKLDISRLDEVMAIENESFTLPFTRSMMENELQNEIAYYIAVHNDGILAGYAGFWKIGSEAHLMTVAVAKAFRRKGIGRALMQHVIGYAVDLGIESMTLEVRVSNTPAISLYESLGFTKAGIRKQYYEDNKEDAYIMWNYCIAKSFNKP
ncbi:MAG TPA: ribosomal protein S18-alanine N-acetyltransferase [Clostridia bacterium]|nr:ribosomal protein S18-alanine N-acetyltransferase [Clostridia bacterium]